MTECQKYRTFELPSEDSSKIKDYIYREIGKEFGIACHAILTRNYRLGHVVFGFPPGEREFVLNNRCNDIDIEKMQLIINTHERTYIYNPLNDSDVKNTFLEKDIKDET